MKVLSPVGTFWIIRHKPTGGWLPELTKPKRGGYTHTEPGFWNTPRLFTTERGAKNALWWWLRGVITTRMRQTFDGDWIEDWDDEPKPGRKAEDMEIVKVDLSVVVEEIA